MVEFRLLGPMEVDSGRGLIEVGQPRIREVLAILLLDAGQAVPAESLIDRLWPQEPPPTARASLYSYLTRVRGALKRAASTGGQTVALRRSSSGYLLDIDRSTCDVHRFHGLVKFAQRQSADDLQRAEALRQAIELWRGQPLAGMSGSWFQQVRDGLQQQRLDVSIAWAQAELAIGNAARVTGALVQLLAEHPYTEAVAAMLMQALHTGGRSADALDCYRRFRDRLTNELGIEPGEHLQDVHRLVLRGEPRSRPRAVAVREAPRVWALPPRLPHLAGRETELETAAAVYARGRSPNVVALWGMAGIGKSCIAVEYAHRAASQYALVAWVPGVRRDTASAALSALGQYLGMTTSEPEGLVHKTLSELDRWQRWLLIYDDADPDEVKPLLPAHGNGDVLITSRSSGWADVAATVEVGPLEHEAAVAVLLEQSQDRSPGAAGHAALLARRLGGLPAAIGLAAAYCRGTCSIAEYRQLLDQTGLDLMRPKHSLGSQGENALAVRLSTRRVSDSTGAARQLLALLAWFAPGYLPQSVIRKHGHLLPQPLRGVAVDPPSWHCCIGELRAAGLIRVEPGRLWNHELVQEVQREQAPRGWRSVALRLVTADFPVSWSNAAVWNHCAALLPHARDLLDDVQDGILLSDLPDHVSGFYLARGQYDDALGLSQRTYELRLQSLGAQDPLTLRALNYLGMATHRTGRYAEATEVHRHELELSRDVLGHDHPGTLASMNNYARALDSLGDYTAARELHEQTLDARRRVLGTAHPATLSSLNNLGNVLLRMRDHHTARDIHLAAFQERRRILGPHHISTLQSMNNLANVSYQVCDLAAAQRHQEVAKIRERIFGPHHPETLISLNNLANALHVQGEDRRAAALHRQVLTARFLQHGPDNPQVLRSMANLAAVLRSLGEHDRPADLQQRCADGRRRILGPNHHDTRDVADPPDPTPNNAEDIK